MKKIAQVPLGLSLLFGLWGCSVTQDVAWPDSRPLGTSIPSFRPPIGPSSDDPTTTPSPYGSISLRDAIALSLLNNPELQAFGWEVRAAEARTIQAALFPNPEIGVELENFAGTGPINGLDVSDVTVSLSQLVELGGDRLKRKRVASLETDLAGWDYETVRLDVLTETTQAFASVLASQERLALADSLTQLARRVFKTVSARVNAGKVSPLEKTRAQIILSSARIENELAVKDLLAKRVQLSATWGSPTALFDRVVGDYYLVTRPPRLDVIYALVDRNPEIVRWADEMALRHSVIALEKARGIPDPVLFAGPRRIRELGETALTAGISIPLPFFDRNQGAIREAKYRLRVTEALQRATEVGTRRRLSDAFQSLDAAYTEIELLSADILPAARENFTGVQIGYTNGKIDLLSVLDAQRTLFETTNQYIDVLDAYHTSLADVERLIATPLSTLQND
ncbi:MAG: TolC family protein [Rhodothermia bacterium]|nr:MAG: TolC family protein [Rhodothermia bacterium]